MTSYPESSPPPIKEEHVTPTSSVKLLHRTSPDLTFDIKTKIRHKQILPSDLVKDPMSDSDDTGPLSQRAKRRRFSSRSTMRSAPETIVIDSDNDSPQPSIPMANDREEVAAMIAELRANLATKKTGMRREASLNQLEIDRLRSALTKQEHEYRQLEAELNRKRDEVDITRSNLCDFQKGDERSKETASSREKALQQARKDIQDFERLAKELPARLNRTGFDSKDASVLTMLRSFHQEIVGKYFCTGDTQAPNADGTNAPTTQRLDPDTKHKLARVVHGLRTHKSYSAFAYPVTEDIAPQYFEIVSHPMDLSTIRGKLDSDSYSSLCEFVADVKLMLENCRKYNGSGSRYAAAADAFEFQIRALMARRGLEGF